MKYAFNVVSGVLNGIFTFLYYNLDEIEYNKRINVESSSQYKEGGGPPSILINPEVTGNTLNDNWHSENVLNSNVTFSLKRFKIKLTSYTLKSRNDISTIFPAEWVLDGRDSDKNNEWFTIDSPGYRTDICSQGAQKNFKVNCNEAFNQFRITQKQNYDYNGFKHFVLNKVEFFGDLIDLTSKYSHKNRNILTNIHVFFCIHINENKNC